LCPNAEKKPDLFTRTFSDECAPSITRPSVLAAAAQVMHAKIPSSANIAREILFIRFSTLLDSDAAAPRIVAGLLPNGFRGLEFQQGWNRLFLFQIFQSLQT
jgi:hypothetical protein